MDKCRNCDMPVKFSRDDKGYLSLRDNDGKTVCPAFPDKYVLHKSSTNLLPPR